MPYEHSENVEDGRKCLELCQQVLEDTKDISEEHAKDSGMLVEFCQKHLDTVEKFGRYPHRNAVLGR